MKELKDLVGDQLSPQPIEKKSHPLDPENFPHNYYSPRSEKYIIKNTIQNLEYFLKYHGIKARLNEMNYRVEVAMNDRIEYSAKNIDHFVIIKSLLAEAGYEKVLNVNDYATQIAIKNMYHPVRDWVLSKPLTTSGNIKKLVKALNPKDHEKAEVLLTTWLVSGIRAWFHEDGIAAQGVLVLYGKTGTRKTSIIKSLLPQDMLLEGHVLNVHKDGNKITALANAITELGEIMASIRISGNDELKGFFTTEKDSIRVPYGRVDTIRQRRTIFAGTVNDSKFLSDETGNRRYWVIEIDDVINTDHGIDIQQLWAEAKHLYDAGAKWYLSQDQEKIVENTNKSYEIENPMEELILSKYDWKGSRERYLNCAQIMEDLGINIENSRASDNVRKALRKMQKEHPAIKSRRVKKGMTYEMPRLLKNISEMESL